MMKRHIFFDMDGTLVDSQAAILGSLQAAMKECGFTPSVELSVDVIGPPVAEIVQSVDPQVPETTLNNIVSSFRRLYDAAPERELRVYDGVPELLHELMSRNFSLHIVTNKPIKPTSRILEFLGWHMFSDVSTPDSWKDGKIRNKAESIAATIMSHGMDKSDVLMLGDTFGDVRAAHTSHIYAAAALWGYEQDKNGLVKEADISFSTVREFEYFLVNVNDIRGIA